MGKHSVPKGEKSSWGQANGSPAIRPNHVPKHGTDPAGSDLPPRGLGVTIDDFKGKK